MDIPESRYEVECARPEDSSTPDFGEEGEVTTPEETADADESEEVSSSPPEEATSSANTAEEDKDATDSWDEPDPMEYDAYLNMSASEQEAYFLSFSSIEAFFEWYNAAKQKYQEENPGVEIGPGGFLPIP